MNCEEKQSWKEKLIFSKIRKSKKKKRKAAQVLFLFCFFKTQQLSNTLLPNALHPQAMPIYGIEIVGLVQRLSGSEREREGDVEPP